MIGLAYDAGLRREELCALRTDDIDPAHRTVRVRAETTKTGYGRVAPYSEITGSLLKNYLGYRSTLSRARGPLFLSESKRNRATPITLWTWSKVVRRVVLQSGSLYQSTCYRFGYTCAARSCVLLSTPPGTGFDSDAVACIILRKRT